MAPLDGSFTPAYGRHFRIYENLTTYGDGDSSDISDDSSPEEESEEEYEVEYEESEEEYEVEYEEDDEEAMYEGEYVLVSEENMFSEDFERAYGQMLRGNLGYIPIMEEEEITNCRHFEMYILLGLCICIIWRMFFNDSFVIVGREDMRNFNNSSSGFM